MSRAFHASHKLPEVLKSIQNAEIIILGPGSLYTSIIPNLLVRKVADAIAQSIAPKVYVVNIMTQPGETDSYKASDHLKVLLEYINIPKFDYVIINKGEIASRTRKKYEKEFAKPVEMNYNNLKKYAKNIIADDFVLIDNGAIRHNSPLLAEKIIEIIPYKKRLWGIIERGEEN